MYLEPWSAVLTRSFQDLFVNVMAYAPGILIGVMVFIVGWLVGAILGKIVAQIIRSLRVDTILRNAGVEDVINKAGFELDSGAFFGKLVELFVMVAVLIAVLSALHLDAVNMFLTQILSYIPQVIIATLILVIAAFVAETLQRIVVGAAMMASVTSAHFLGALTRWAIWIFAILVALNQLGIAGYFAQTLFMGLVIMLALAGGLAFGLGGRDAAGRFIDRVTREMSDHHHTH